MTRNIRGPARFSFLDSPLPLAFVHRGGSSHGTENSLSAFSAAIDLGYRYLETDVHTTSDDVAVVFHDRTLDRVTDRTGRIDRLPWSQVRKARIAGTEPIPRLDELLSAFPQLRINIDMKSPGAVPGVTKAIERGASTAFPGRRSGRHASPAPSRSPASMNSWRRFRHCASTST